MKKKMMYVGYTGRNNRFAIHGRVYEVSTTESPSHVFIKEMRYFVFKDDFEVLSAPEVMLHKARMRSETCGNWKVQK
jgi:hypothetical protein